MKFTIDRFEGNSAVVELADRTTIEIPKDILPDHAKEGDIISVQIESEETVRQENAIKDRMKHLFKD